MKKILLYSLSILAFLTITFVGIGVYSFLEIDDEPRDNRKRGQFHGFDQTVTVANGPGIDSIVVVQSEYETAEQFISDLKETSKETSNAEKLQTLAVGIVIYSNYFLEKKSLATEFKYLREDAMDVYIAENEEDLQIANEKLMQTIDRIHKLYFGK